MLKRILAGALSIALACTAGADGTQGATGQESDFQFSQGRLAYRKIAPAGFERGRELWWLTRNRDGSRTMRSLAMTDDSKFVRDVTYTLDRNGRPMRLYIQLQVDEELVGSGYFHVSGNTMNVVTDSVDTGHTIQSVTVPEKFHILTHAVMLDAWPAWSYELEEGGSQTIAVYTTSPLWNGTSGPLGRMTTQRFTLHGTEEITVPAGTFTARHFSFGGDDGSGRVSHIWVTGKENILLKYEWPHFGMEYVLETLQVGAETQVTE
tara:strand:- start:2071 stop:2862 length:792 start_codon:yes stop_codon:yes gene_type:complete